MCNSQLRAESVISYSTEITKINLQHIVFFCQEGNLFLSMSMKWTRWDISVFLSQRALWEVVADDSCIANWPSGKFPCAFWGRGWFSWWQWNRWDTQLHPVRRLLAATGCQKQYLRKCRGNVTLSVSQSQIFTKHALNLPFKDQWIFN